MTTWKYMSGGQQYGPVDTEAIIELLKGGTLNKDAQVMKEGGLNWAPISAFPEFHAATTSSAAPPPVAGANDLLDTSDVDKNKVFAILAYIGILFLVPLLAAPNSKFARYHTNQGVILFLASIVVWIAAVILGHIPFVGCITIPAAGLSILVFIVLGVINAASGKYKPLPLIGHFTIIK